MKFKRLAMTAAGLMIAGALTFSGCLGSGETTDDKNTGNIESKADDVKSEVKLGEYKGIQVTVEALPDITDADVINTVLAAVENATVTNEIKDRAVAEGDTVNVSYTGYMDDEEIPDSSVEDYNMLIGSGIFFNGAEDGLVGAMPGDTVDISVTYPDGYPQEELVGKSAVYKVTINYIVQEQQAELTAEFVASISDCKTVEEYQQYVKEELVKSRENEREMNRRNAVWELVMDNAEVTAYSDSDIQAIASEYKSYDESAAEDFGMTFEDYVKTYQNMSLDEYNTAIEDMAKQEIKQELVIDAIAEAENINGDDMTEEEIERCAREQNYDNVSDYKKSREEADMKEDVKRIRVMDFVVGSAAITETPAAVTETSGAVTETPAADSSETSGSGV